MKGNAMAKEKNIWVERKLAPLEYCSIVRSSQLLNCEISDIVHWMELGAIHSYGKFKGEQSEIGFRIENLETYTESFYGGIAYETRFINGHSLFIAEQEPVPDENMRVFVGGNIYGYWRIHQLKFGELEFNNIVYPVRRAENSRHFHVKLPASFVLDVNDIYISKEDIEKIHTHSLQGKVIPSDKSSPLNDINTNDCSLTGSRYIDLLNVLIGTHQAFGEGSLSMTDNALVSKIGGYAAKELRRLGSTPKASPILIEALEKCTKLDRKTLARFRGNSD